MWIKRLPAAVAATSLAGLHGSERHLRLLTSTPTVTATGLHALATATTESELAESLLHESGDNVRHFWFI